MSPDTEKPDQDDLLEDAYAFAYGLDPDSDPYRRTLESIDKLESISRAKHRSWKPSPDAVLSSATSLLGILIIVKAESIFPIASKALSIATKIRL